MEIEFNLWARAVGATSAALLSTGLGAYPGILAGWLLSDLLTRGESARLSVPDDFLARLAGRVEAGVLESTTAAQREAIHSGLTGAFGAALREALYDLGGASCFPQAWPGNGRAAPSGVDYPSTHLGAQLWQKNSPLASKACAWFVETAGRAETSPWNAPLRPVLQATMYRALSASFVDPFLAGQEWLAEDLPDLATHLRTFLLDRWLIHLGNNLRAQPAAWEGWLQSWLGQARQAELPGPLRERLEALFPSGEAGAVQQRAVDLAGMLAGIGRAEKKAATPLSELCADQLAAYLGESLPALRSAATIGPSPGAVSGPPPSSGQGGAAGSLPPVAPPPGAARRRPSGWRLPGWVGIALALLAGLSLAGAVFFYLLYRQRDSAADRYSAALVETNARILAAQAETAFPQAPQRALLLLVEAVRITDKAKDPPVPAVETTLRRQLSLSGGQKLAGGPVAHLAFSADGRWLATAGQDGQVSLWDPADLKTPQTLSGPSGEVSALGFDPAGRWLAAAGEDGVLRVWVLDNLNAGALVVQRHTGAILAMAFSADGRWLATSSTDVSLLLWNAADLSADPVALLGASGSADRLAFSPDGRWLAGQGPDAALLVWPLDQPGASALPLPGAAGQVLSIAFSPDGQWLAAGSSDALLRVWSAADWQAAPRMLSGHSDPISSLAFSPDSRWLASGGQDGTIRRWDLTQLDALPVLLRGHTAAVYALQFSPDGSRLASAGADQTLRLWDAANPEAAPLSLHAHEAAVNEIAFSPDSRWLASLSQDGEARLWAASSPTAEPVTLRGHTDLVSAVAVSPDSRWLASAGWDHSVRLWDLQDLSADPLVLEGHTDRVTSLAFSPDGQRLASGSWDMTLRLWDVAAPLAAPVTLQAAGAVNGVAFSRDGQWLASAESDATVRVWNSADWSAAPQVLTGHTEDVTAVAFDPADGSLASSSWDKTTLVWRLDQGKEEPILVRLEGHNDLVNAVGYTADGRWLATAGADGALRLWASERLSNPPTLYPSTGDVVYSLAFNPGGDRLAAGDDDGQIDLWRIGGSIDEAVRIAAGTGPVFALAFSPDGRWLVSGGDDHQVRLFHAQVSDLVDLACQVAGRNLTEQEWREYFPDEKYHATCEQWPSAVDATQTR